MSEATTPDILAVIKPVLSPTLQRMVQTPGRAIARAKQTTRKAINDKGYRFSVQLGFNASHGGMNRGGTMLVGNADRYIELCIGSVVSNGARAWDGGVLQHQSDPSYRGLSEAEQMMQDADVHAMEHDKNFCYGGSLYSRGVVTAVSYDSGTGLSTVTFDSANGGSYFLKGTESGSASKINMQYFFHHPTTFALHGGTDPFPLVDVPTKTTARFKGDATGGTTVAALDIVVPAGTADKLSSIHKGIRNLEYFCGNSGDYFTGNRDVEDKLCGIRHDAAGDAIDRAMLEYMDSLYTFKWPQDEAGTSNHVDFISPTQRAKMLFKAEGPWRLNDESYRNYDPKNDFRGWGGREYVIDVYILATNWYIMFLKELYHYEQRPWDTWDYDGLQRRAIPASGSIRDALQSHYLSVDQYGHEMPGKNLQIFSAQTTGAATSTDS